MLNSMPTLLRTTRSTRASTTNACRPHNEGTNENAPCVVLYTQYGFSDVLSVKWI